MVHSILEARDLSPCTQRVPEAKGLTDGGDASLVLSMTTLPQFETDLAGQSAFDDAASCGNIRVNT